MFHFSTAETALRTAQVGLDIVSNNIANASTPGYHRQLVRQVDRLPIEVDRQVIGTGVEVARIDRILHRATEESITSNISDLGILEPQIQLLQRLQSLLAPTHGSLYDRLGAFLRHLQTLSSTPDDLGARREVVNSAAQLAQEVRSLTDGLAGLSQELTQEIQHDVELVNRKTEQIVDLNQRIAVLEGRGLVPNDLHDRRDALVNELAELVNVRRVTPDEGPPAIQFGDVGYAGYRSPRIEVVSDEAGQLKLTKNGHTLQLAGGRLAGLLQLKNSLLMQYQGQVELFADAMVEAFNRVHVHGVGTQGRFEMLVSGNAVSDSTAPLADALDTVPQAGEIFVTVVDQTTGQSRLHRLDVDPEAHSLSDLATMFNAVTGLQALINETTGTLSIVAGNGYEFDFAGSPPRVVEAESASGTATLTLTADRNTATNQQFRLRVDGSGSVGVTPGLKLSLLDLQGNLVRQVNVGLGFDHGQPLPLTDELSITLGSGTLVDGDTYLLEAVGEPDTTGLLAGLGINTLFLGNGLTMRVDPRLVEHPQLLALSRDGHPGDTTNLRELVGVGQLRLMADGAQTLEDYVVNFISTVGAQINVLEAEQEAVTQIGQALQEEYISQSGVDPNAELIRMLQYQRSFQMASRYISTVNEMLDDLLAIVR